MEPWELLSQGCPGDRGCHVETVRAWAGRDLQLTRVNQQLGLAEHLARSVAGEAGVDASVVWGHILQQQGVSGAILLLAQPGTVLQLDTVLQHQKASCRQPLPAPGPPAPPWATAVCLAPRPAPCPALAGRGDVGGAVQ